MNSCQRVLLFYSYPSATLHLRNPTLADLQPTYIGLLNKRGIVWCLLPPTSKTARGGFLSEVFAYFLIPYKPFTHPGQSPPPSHRISRGWTKHEPARVENKGLWNFPWKIWNMSKTLKQNPFNYVPYMKHKTTRKKKHCAQQQKMV